jgi:hypothetical protein
VSAIPEIAVSRRGFPLWGLHRQRDELRAVLVELEPHFGAARKRLQAMLAALR